MLFNANGCVLGREQNPYHHHASSFTPLPRKANRPGALDTSQQRKIVVVDKMTGRGAQVHRSEKDEEVAMLRARLAPFRHLSNEQDAAAAAAARRSAMYAAKKRQRMKGKHVRASAVRHSSGRNRDAAAQEQRGERNETAFLEQRESLAWRNSAKFPTTNTPTPTATAMDADGESRRDYKWRVGNSVSRARASVSLADSPATGRPASLSHSLMIKVGGMIDVGKTQAGLGEQSSRQPHHTIQPQSPNTPSVRAHWATPTRALPTSSVKDVWGSKHRSIGERRSHGHGSSTREGKPRSSNTESATDLDSLPLEARSWGGDSARSKTVHVRAPPGGSTTPGFIRRIFSAKHVSSPECIVRAGGGSHLPTSPVVRSKAVPSSPAPPSTPPPPLGSAASSWSSVPSGGQRRAAAVMQASSMLSPRKLRRSFRWTPRW